MAWLARAETCQVPPSKWPSGCVLMQRRSTMLLPQNPVCMGAHMHRLLYIRWLHCPVRFEPVHQGRIFRRRAFLRQSSTLLRIFRWPWFELVFHVSSHPLCFALLSCVLVVVVIQSLCRCHCACFLSFTPTTILSAPSLPHPHNLISQLPPSPAHSHLLPRASLRFKAALRSCCLP